MAESVVFDTEGLSNVALSVAAYIKQYSAALEEAIRNIQTLSEEWNDEDLVNLMQGLKAMYSDLNELSEKTAELKEKAKAKLDAIGDLHSIKI